MSMSVSGSESAPSPLPTHRARVALRRAADNTPEAIHRAVELALEDTPAAHELIRPGSRVFLKVNLVTNASAAEGICTDPEVVRAAIRFVQKKGAVPVVGDNPALASMKSVLKTSGIAKVIEETGAEVPDLSETAALTCRRAVRFNEFTVSRAILDADVLFSLSKLKTHALTYMSMATKNLFGVIPGTRKARWHVKAPHADMMATLFCDLYSGLLDAFREKGSGLIHLCDGVTALEGDGPGHSGQPKFVGAILASDDAAALDRVGVEVAGLDANRLATLQKEIRRGLGVGKLEEIEIAGASLSEFADIRLKAPNGGGLRLEGLGIRLANLPWVRSLIAEHPLLAAPEKCVGCKRCAGICPAGAITFREGEGAPKTPAFDKSPCIRCYCCAEVCPVGAIAKSPTPLLGRLMRRL